MQKSKSIIFVGNKNPYNFSYKILRCVIKYPSNHTIIGDMAKGGIKFYTLISCYRRKSLWIVH